MQLVIPRTDLHLPRTMASIQRLRLPLTLLPVPIAYATVLPFTLPPHTTGVIFTSGHAVQAAAQQPWRGPAWCVGTTTAMAATAAGFTLAGTGPSNATAMARAMAAAGTSGHWVHLSTPSAHSCWHPHASCTITTLPVYRLTYLTQLPTTLLAQLAPPAQRIGMGFSPRALGAWQKLLNGANIPLEAQGIAISPAVGRLAPTWRVATIPNLSGMLIQLKDLCDDTQK